MRIIGNLAPWLLFSFLDKNDALEDCQETANETGKLRK